MAVPGKHRDLVQVGNRGPPIETPEGWLVLTHGMGPMRLYSMGAMLLALDDPAKALATLPDPLSGFVTAQPRVAPRCQRSASAAAVDRF